MKDKSIGNPFIFQWPVHPSGYRWQEVKPSSPKGALADLFLVPCDPDERPRIINPLEQTGLFKNFASLPLDGLEPIRSFADKFGLIGRAWHRSRPSDVSESLTIWQNEILRLRDLVAFWEATAARDKDFLGRAITWDVNFRTVSFSVDRYASSELSHTEWIPEKEIIEASEAQMLGLKHGDVIAPAWHIIRVMVNRQLLFHQTVPFIDWDRADTDLALYLRPIDLASAVWLQFASALTRNTTLRSCEICREWFQVGPGAARTDATTCSGKCRSRKFRRDKPGNKPKKGRAKR